MTDTALLVTLALVWVSWFTLSFWESLSMSMLMAAVSDERKTMMQDRRDEAFWRIRAFSAQWRAIFGATAYGSIVALILSDVEGALPVFVLVVALCLTAILAVYTTLAVMYSPFHALNRRGFIQRMAFTWMFAASLAVGAYLLIAFIRGLSQGEDLFGRIVVFWSIAAAVVPLGKIALDTVKSTKYPIFACPFTFEEMRPPVPAGQEAGSIRLASTPPARTD
jgi:hypothetical protein